MNYDILLEQLKDFEGLELKAYQCTAGKTTIGLGRNLDDTILLKIIFMNQKMNQIGLFLGGDNQMMQDKEL